ncbi:hypothetical protein OHC33_001770 [Knufia fluminis]|uniref:Uncharacterized protein n=1 Tax=Knufia fluminis TaxID=191047 RepID=A0AAN8IAZ0_9EURO|nr:hypothetical protein OHC33_001770 [Knufia fluminis]
MALAMTPATLPTTQDDIMDIDIDMDVDDTVPVAGEDEILEEGEEPEFIPTGHQVSTGEVAAIYLEDPAQEPQWEKVHISGVDDLSTDNIRTFASDYFTEADPYVQWVDDTSANLVYKDKSLAKKALLEFVMHPITEQDVTDHPFVLRTAKPLVINPGAMLQVRIAMVGDRKKKGAKDASRYYLMHPEADPAERARRVGRGESGDYKRRRFDDREHRRRRHQDDNADATNDFEASMYDDAPAKKKTTTRGRGQDLFSRVDRRHRSASPVANGDAIAISDSDSESGPRRQRRNGYRNRDSPPPRRRNNTGRELFEISSHSTPRSSGLRSDDPSIFTRISKSLQSEPKDRTMTTSYETNQGVARQLRADLKAAQNNSPARSHRRAHALDSRLEEDLAERFGRKSLSLDSTKSIREQTVNSGKELFDRDVNTGFSIKGSANQGMSIKGRAGDVKELFPDRFSTGNGGRGGNRGKELFDQPVRARGPRQRAGDLFD